jgi:hypothetical protein
MVTSRTSPLARATLSVTGAHFLNHTGVPQTMSSHKKVRVQETLAAGAAGTWVDAGLLADALLGALTTAGSKTMTCVACGTARCLDLVTWPSCCRAEGAHCVCLECFQHGQASGLFPRLQVLHLPDGTRKVVFEAGVLGDLDLYQMPCPGCPDNSLVGHSALRWWAVTPWQLELPDHVRVEADPLWVAGAVVCKCGEGAFPRRSVWLKHIVHCAKRPRWMICPGCRQWVQLAEPWDGNCAVAPIIDVATTPTLLSELSRLLHEHMQTCSLTALPGKAGKVAKKDQLLAVASSRKRPAPTPAMDSVQTAIVDADADADADGDGLV